MKPLIALCASLLCVQAAPGLAVEPVSAAEREAALASFQESHAVLPAAPHAVSESAPAFPVRTHDLTGSHTDIWDRIRQGFGMQDLYGAEVTERQQWYLARPQALTVMLERGRKYLFHIMGELERRGMPSELALLPLVESAFNPMALSSAKAAGLWQFIPSTGRSYNLDQNWWVDERRDVLASTDAALNYLASIYEMHGDWHLALASYNWGENAVARAVNNNRAAGLPTDFNSLRMPKETRYYVPKLQALKNIIAHPERYGVTLPTIPDEAYFVSVPRQQGIDVALAAKLAELPLDEFRELNPGYNRPVIPGSNSAPLLLPVANARKFEVNIATHDSPLVSWRTYSVPKSSRIEQVAQRLRLSVDTLRQANGLPARALLHAGYTLLIPAKVDEALLKYIPSTRAVSASSGKTAKGKTRSATRAVQRKPVKVTLKAAPKG